MRFTRIHGLPASILAYALSACIASPAAALTLRDAIGQALARNERAGSAEETARAADARVWRARSFLLPTITLSGDYTRRGSDGQDLLLSGREGRVGRVTVEQTIFDAQAWPLLRQATRAREAAQLDAVGAKRLLAFDTAATFLSVLNSEQVARAAAERSDLARQALNEIRIRFDAGLVGSNDVTRAELEAASAERELVTSRGAARTARLALGLLLAASVEDSLSVPDDLLSSAARPVPPGSLDVAAAADLRPDVRSERARVAALRMGALEPLARYLPDLVATGTARANAGSVNDVRDQDWTAGLSLRWELFDGGGREAERAERSALARASGLALASLERTAANQMETARVGLESQQASLVRSRVAVDAARRNALEASELYRRGLTRALEVVDANVQLFEAEVERAGAEFALALAYLDLRSALGLEPLEPETIP
jgi:outer membrane protein TolC